MATAPFFTSDKRPTSLSFTSGRPSASSAQSPLLPFLSRNFISPSPNGAGPKRKADGEIMDEEVQSPAKQFYVDWEFQEHVLEGGFFRDTNCVSTSKWEGDNNKEAEDSKMEEEEDEWLPLPQVSSVPFFGLAPLTPAGFSPKVGKRRLPGASTPTTEGAMGSEHHQTFPGPPGFQFHQS